MLRHMLGTHKGTTEHELTTHRAFGAVQRLVAIVGFLLMAALSSRIERRSDRRRLHTLGLGGTRVA